MGYTKNKETKKPGKGGKTMEQKTVSISAKRQITIPQKFFTKLGFETEAECILRGEELILRPVRRTSGGEFAEQILADLLAQGCPTEELLERFRQKQAQVRPAVEQLLREAEDAAAGTGDFATLDEVFGQEDTV
jgi:bifunctional DNA-binding transcriptional regulator/antitoxin component of YhaV-PrlF toxin-antitoxin module